MKNKKRLLKTVVTLIFLIIVTIPFIDWFIKYKTHNDFIELEHEINNSLSGDFLTFNDSINTYCDTVMIFIVNHPVDLVREFNCTDYNIETDSSDLRILREKFLTNVLNVRISYSASKLKANGLMILILILGHIFAAISRKLIDKRFN